MGVRDETRHAAPRIHIARRLGHRRVGKGAALGRDRGRCTAARARNRPFERPTHATVGALGVVCANGCAGSPAQCHAWHADWWCPWPPPLRRWEARATRIGGSSSCRGSWDARANPGELTQRTALLNTSEPRCTAWEECWGGVTTELCVRLFAFLAQVLGSPLRGKSNSLERRIGNVGKKSD